MAIVIARRLRAEAALCGRLLHMAHIEFIKPLQQIGKSVTLIGVAARDGRSAFWCAVIDDTHVRYSGIDGHQLLAHVAAAEQALQRQRQLFEALQYRFVMTQRAIVQVLYQ